jgi:hypothetical protein
MLHNYEECSFFSEIWPLAFAHTLERPAFPEIPDRPQSLEPLLALDHDTESADIVSCAAATCGRPSKCILLHRVVSQNPPLTICESLSRRIVTPSLI